ncbi:dienelactone hydrolase family protein [Desulfobulbus alkaliphilus]|uniref:dienelactone hydrolase family protein n=1 Tax=Desulfobulbus alkaliphilus TaxID=869814 RepID=UPI00196313D6|nr:dienelactone hydrolase family protein [Desulfobulbus alkaliphilus]MBM9536524.1 dienelactone hydrolase family protein [Desulfobulbus alkaliphilus]
MRTLLFALVFILLSGFPALAGIVTKTVSYNIDENIFEGIIVYDSTANSIRPGVLMVPNWMGPSEQSLEKAARVAGDKYVVFIIDMYGREIRPKDSSEAAIAAGQVRQDRELMRKRVNVALTTFREQSDEVPLDPARIAAIGFCFGGGVVLELARSGTELKGVVSFHGNLDTPNTADAQNIQAKVLVLHGADDPLVPDEQVQTFISEMRDGDVDWQLVHYGGAVHSFTDPYASMPGRAEYHPEVARRAFTTMELFFQEIFD